MYIVYMYILPYSIPCVVKMIEDVCLHKYILLLFQSLHQLIYVA